jgi:hypothetical protein
MKIGDIIRRKASDGCPIGPYMQIMAIKDDYVYADVIGLDEPNILILKKDVHVCTISTLIISEQLLHDLEYGNKFVVSHLETKMWKNVLIKKPELIRFRTALKNYQHVFVIDTYRRMLSCGELYIKIIVDQKVM